MSAVRSRMTQRAVVQRDTAVGEDDYGQPTAPNYQTHGTFPCWLYSSSRTEIVDGRKTTVVDDSLSLLFPLGTDVRRGDQITQITDRNGNELVPGLMRLTTNPKYVRDHLEVQCEKVE